jgi:hypothetical protein
MSDFDPHELVRFIPGDRFAGWDRQSLIDRLVLSPQTGPIDLSPATGRLELMIWIDDEEVDVVRERGGLPLPADVEIQDHPIVTISMTGNPEWAVLYESRPWLLSMLGGQPDRLIPIPTNPMGEESDTRRTYEAWAWVIEMTLAWAESGQAGDLAITSLLLQEEEDSQEMEPYVSQAAQGGLGMVRLNGEVVHDGGSHR